MSILSSSTITAVRLVSNIIRNMGLQSATRFHTFCSPNNTGALLTSNFLKPASYINVPANTMMTKPKVYKSCQYCYFMWRDNRKFVYCKKHPSHNQQTRMPSNKESFIITHKTAGRKRPY